MDVFYLLFKPHCLTAKLPEQKASRTERGTTITLCGPCCESEKGSWKGRGDGGVGSCGVVAFPQCGSAIIHVSQLLRRRESHFLPPRTPLVRKRSCSIHPFFPGTPLHPDGQGLKTNWGYRGIERAMYGHAALRRQAICCDEEASLVTSFRVPLQAHCVAPIR